MAKRRSFRSFLVARWLSWRHFWSLRAPWRIALTKLCALVAFLIVVYVVIPRDAQSWVNQAVLATSQVIGLLSPLEVLAGVAALLVLVCLCLVFVRPSRRASYFAAMSSAMPQISVYIDAENQIPEPAIRPFTKFLMQYLNGRRADLLYFLDASQTARSEKYKLLYRFGFRPVDVPHDPTGTVSVKEAVDKELSMHAHERALLGPPKQEFIIVTGDQDFVALVYRLAALGHHVQVWATPIRAAYRALATYLDIELIDLSHVVSDVRSSAPEDIDDADDAKPGRELAAQTLNGAPGHDGQSTLPSYETADPTLLSEAGEQQIFRAIIQTLKARNECETKFSTNAQRVNTFRGMLGGELAPRLASVGYAAPSRIDYWLAHLRAMGIFSKQSKQKDRLPVPGSTSAENAAHALFIVAQLAANAAIAAGREHGDEAFATHTIADRLIEQQAQAQGTVRSLLDLIARSNQRRATHARYFVHSARALGLIEFDDVPNLLDMLRAPRVIGTSTSDASNEIARQAEAAAPADEATSDAAPMDAAPTDVMPADAAPTGAAPTGAAPTSVNDATDDAEEAPASTPEALDSDLSEDGIVGEDGKVAM